MKNTLELGLEKDRYVSRRHLTLFTLLAFVLGVGVMYLWYEPYVWESKRLLKENIYQLEEQRDQLLLHRSQLKRQLDAAYDQLHELGV